MTLKNIVTAGDYEDRHLEVSGKKIFIRDGNFGFGKKIFIDKDTVEAYEVVGEDVKTSGASAIARGAIGSAILGPVGLLAGVSAKKKGIHTVAVQFKDGKKSLMDLDDQFFQVVVKRLF